ncbi:hypothetical protein AB4Z42_16255 [Mycobacterium sp. 2YAF39]|uniref:hypothetical protein n=1 Tax=Mycobacterium sp. 2YAF39 TaxID=3233033 RepID=UPI003F980B35
MAESVALWGRDIDESTAEPDGAHVTDGQHDPNTAPIPVVSDDSGGYDPQGDYNVQFVDFDEPGGYVKDQSSYLEETVEPVASAEPVIDRRPSAGSTLTFKPARAPWYRTRRGLIVLIAVIAVAVVLAIIPMLLRTPGPSSEEPANVTPTTEQVPSSVAPTTGGTAPTLTSQPARPSAPPPPPASPPPPPPPPPAQDAPVYVPQYQAPRGGSASDGPQIGVTRAPISVAPKPVTPPSTAEVGVDGGNGNWHRRW